VIDPFDRLLVDLVSEELGGVTFVRDYVQLRFGSPPTLNAYTPVTVRVQGAAVSSGDDDFARTLVAQIGKRVSAVHRHPSERLEIMFEDSSAIDIALQPESYRGPEAFEYRGRRGDVAIE
jgi:hypothetical protein